MTNSQHATVIRQGAYWFVITDGDFDGPYITEAEATIAARQKLDAAPPSQHPPFCAQAALS